MLQPDLGLSHSLSKHKDSVKKEEKSCMKTVKKFRQKEVKAQRVVREEGGFIRFYLQISVRHAPPTMPVSNDCYFPSDAQISDDPESSHDDFNHNVCCKVGDERGFDTPLCVSQSRAGGKQGGPTNQWKL